MGARGGGVEWLFKSSSSSSSSNKHPAVVSGTIPDRMFSSSHMNGYGNPGLSEQGNQPPHRERAVDCPGDKEGGDGRPSRCGAQMERIQHYQEELRKRREEEGGGRARHEVDPDASLRLKKLSQNPKVGIDNPTFDGKERLPEHGPPEHGPDPAAGECCRGRFISYSGW